MDNPAIPPAIGFQLGLDLLKRDWKSSLEQLVTDFTQGFFHRPPVELARAAIPEPDAPGRKIPDKNRIVGEIQELSLPPLRLHCGYSRPGFLLQPTCKRVNLGLFDPKLALELVILFASFL